MMERFSYIRGRNETGVYQNLGYSSGIQKYIIDIGAPNFVQVLEAVQKEIVGFKILDGYDDNPKDNLPLAVRYAPMHLYNLPEMPKTIQPFCALSVNGAEIALGSRDSVYSQTFIISREAMHKAQLEKGQKYTYLDQIFGTRMINWQEYDAIKNKKQPTDYNTIPAKVTPELRHQDRNLVYTTLEALYDHKTVVIQLEKGLVFNDRSRQILIQIYSLLQPKFAAEIGFASYHEPSQIRDLAARTSVRLFLLPGEVNVSSLAGEDIVLLDLNKEVPTPEKTEFLAQVNKWSRNAWPERQEILEALFADTAATYLDKNLFITRSQEFFNDPFFAWSKDANRKGSVKTLDELKKLYESFQVCERIPYAKDIFLKAVPMLLAPQKLEAMVADVAAGSFLGEGEKKLHSQELYKFALTMGMDAKAIPYSCKAVAAWLNKDHREAVDTIHEGYKNEITALNAKHGIAIADREQKIQEEKDRAAVEKKTMQTQHQSALDQLKRDHENTVSQLSAQYEAQVADREKKILEEQGRTAQAVTEGEQKVQAEKSRSEAEKEAIQVKHQEEVRLLKEDCQKAIDEEQEKTAQAVREGLANVEEVKAQARQAHENLKAKCTELVTQEREKTAVVQKNLDEVRVEKQSLINTLEDQKRQNSELTQKLTVSGEAARRFKRELDQEHQRTTRLQEELAEEKVKNQPLNDEILQLKNKIQDKDRTIAKFRDGKGEPKPWLFAAAGFAVAVLLFTIGILVYGLLNKEEPTPPPVPTMVATEAATEATAEPTEAPTEPDFENWENGTAAQWLQENVSGCQVASLPEGMEVPALWPAEEVSEVAQGGDTEESQMEDAESTALVQEEYACAAVFQLDEKSDTYAVLMKYVGLHTTESEEKAEDGEQEPTTENVEEMEVETVAETESIEELDSEAEDSEEAEQMEATVPEMEPVPELVAILTSGDYKLCLMGDASSLPTARDLLSAIQPEEMIEVEWFWEEEFVNLDELLNISSASREWLKNVIAVAVAEEAEDPAYTLYFVDGTVKLYVFADEESAVTMVNEQAAFSMDNWAALWQPFEDMKETENTEGPDVMETEVSEQETTETPTKASG